MVIVKVCILFNFKNFFLKGLWIDINKLGVVAQMMAEHAGRKRVKKEDLEFARMIREAFGRKI